MTAPAAAPQTTALTRTRERVSAILLNDEARRLITPFLHQGVSIERVISEVNRVAIENPELLDATPESLIVAVSQCAKWDLAIGETVHLVPFNVTVKGVQGAPDRKEKRIKALRDYKGMVEMVVRAGCARSIDAQNVYEKEVFKYHQGTDPWVEHFPILDPRARGKQIGSYAVARLSHYIKKIVFLSVEEIEKVRSSHSKQWKQGALPDWYGPKTCVHRVVKLIPKNPKLAEIIKAFEEEEIPDAQYEVVSTSATAGSEPQPADGSSPESAPVEGATTAPAAATSTDATPALEPDPAAMTLDQAKGLKLFGQPGAWGGKAGELLDSFSTGHLQQIKRWCVDRIEENGDDPVKQETIIAIDLILADRAKDQTQLPLGNAK